VPLGLPIPADYEVPLGAVSGVLRTSWSRTEVGTLKAVKRPKLTETRATLMIAQGCMV
jgi:hypothetical protein